jgi:CRISPR-associated protein Cas1
VTGGRPLHLIGPDLSLSRAGRRLVVRRGPAVVGSAPLTMVTKVILHGAGQVTTSAMTALLAAGIPLVLLTGSGRALGRLEPPGSPHVAVRWAQLKASADAGNRMEIARRLVDGKIANQRMLVQRQVREHQCLLPGGEAACARLTRVQRRIAACTDLSSLRGVEGACASIYWSQLRPLLAPYGFQGRSRHGRDIANASFNYASALLREAVLTQVTVAGLDTQVSFLHEPYRGRPSLVFDLMEEWRPVLLETTVLGVLALRMVQPEDLEQRNGLARLSLRARAQIIRRFEERLAAPISSRDRDRGRPRSGCGSRPPGWWRRSAVDPPTRRSGGGDGGGHPRPS